MKIKRVVLNGTLLSDEKTAHGYLKEKLDFPEYYGRNLDALYDCLTELTDMELVIIESEETTGYFQKIKRVFLGAQRKNKRITIQFE